MELLEDRGLVRGRRTLATVAVLGILGVAALFEIIEWTYAALSDPHSGALVLGSQGDPWDAQKDMLADGLGALITSLAYCLLRPFPERESGLKNRVADSNSVLSDGSAPAPPLGFK